MLAGSNTSFINRWKEFPCVILIFKINQFILKIRDQRWVEIRVFTEFWIFVKGVYSVSTWTIIKRNLLFHGERGKVIFRLKLHVITEALESLCCTYPDFWSKWSSHVMLCLLFNDTTNPLPSFLQNKLNEIVGQESTSFTNFAFSFNSV